MVLVSLPLMLVACATNTRQRLSVPGVRSAPTLQDEVSRAREVLGPLAGHAAGLSVAVARAGRVVWSEAYGYRDLQTRQAMTPATILRLYSVSKPITAVAAARLLEQGRLDPAAPVQRYVPAFPARGEPITPMQLATHSSGIRHYADDTEARSRQHCATVAEALAIFADDSLVHPPGARETYSSWGYVLLSAVLEGITGQRYDQAMSDLVFQPLAMRSLVIDDPSVAMPTRARFHEETAPGEFALAAEVDNTCKWGAGAWLATAADVAQFGLALIGGPLLQPPSRQLFLRGQSVYRAQGIGAGGAAFLLVDQANDLSIALLSNAIGPTLGPRLQVAVGRLHAVFADEATPQ
jgi:CubicO group peptidase (beta-lactamase class C family)